MEVPRASDFWTKQSPTKIDILGPFEAHKRNERPASLTGRLDRAAALAINTLAGGLARAEPDFVASRAAIKRSRMGRKEKRDERDALESSSWECAPVTNFHGGWFGTKVSRGEPC